MIISTTATSVFEVLGINTNVICIKFIYNDGISREIFKVTQKKYQSIYWLAFTLPSSAEWRKKYFETFLLIFGAEFTGFGSHLRLCSALPSETNV